MKSSFRHSPIVHLLGIGGFIFCAWLGYRSSVDHFERGGLAMRIALVSGCLFLGISALTLYLTSGINRYEVTADGLRVRRLLRTTFHPWMEVTRIDLNNPLHYVVIRGRDRAIGYTSTDFFPRLIDFLQLVHERSKCALAPALHEILAADQSSPAD